MANKSRPRDELVTLSSHSQCLLLPFALGAAPALVKKAPAESQAVSNGAGRHVLGGSGLSLGFSSHPQESKLALRRAN